ncbi:MAG: glycoside hydrolase family 15 protein [Desulfuromonadales bacterium]
MARDVPVGNGRLLVACDGNGLIRDFYYPHVGEQNHAGGPFRVGLWEDGEFVWLPHDWTCSVNYLDATMVTEVAWSSGQRGLSLVYNDLVDFQDNLHLRRLTVKNLETRPRQLRLFFAFDFAINGNDIGDTAELRPESGGILHYKDNRYFLSNASLRGRTGFDQYATGNRRGGASEGTWKDAEDGLLGGNPIAQGSVDSVGALHLSLAASGEEEAWLWMAVGESWEEVLTLNRAVVRRGPERFFRRTGDYWRFWASKEADDVAGLPETVGRLYRHSLLIIRTQIDNNGAIVAANDSDYVQYNRDTYSYVWPRDGALVAQALDLAGYHELSRAFFNFCGQVVEKDGYFLHKYTPSGRAASSWLPWIKDGRHQLPIQEDETALVIWALWDHYARYRDIDFITPLYRPLIKNGANFLMNYRDPATCLPLPSYDLWEERQSVQTFTVAAVYGGLLAAANFVAAFGETELAADYRAGAAALCEAAERWLYLPEAGYFARAISFPIDGGAPSIDRTVDASICGRFLLGLFPADDPRVVSSLRKVREALWCPRTGGLARYENDPYYRYGSEGSGNPWFVTTLWYARFLIAVAKKTADLAPALELLEWTAAHALPSGVLAEQIDSASGAPLSVSPLTWSHATIVTTVCAYREKWRELS